MKNLDLILKTKTFLAKDEEDQQVVTTLAKATFDIIPQGPLQPSAEPLDFIASDELVAKETEPGYYPVAEIEFLPYKLKTDVIVTGDIVAPGEKPVAHMTAEVHIGEVYKTIQVFGDRIVETRDGLNLRFSQPESFVRLPLSYALAYGGVDPSVPRNEDPKTVAEWSEYLTLERHPGVYPRNPVGQAYVVNPHLWLLNGRPLPNFEDPLDLLTPERPGRPSARKLVATADACRLWLVRTDLVSPLCLWWNAPTVFTRSNTDQGDRPQPGSKRPYQRRTVT